MIPREAGGRLQLGGHAGAPQASRKRNFLCCSRLKMGRKRGGMSWSIASIFKGGFIWANPFASGFPLQSFLRQKWFIAPLQSLALLLPSSQPAISLTINH
ncbi:MAG: hypothetical protein CRN43_18410 [Candidatus Nephrothrix sp. EaCA]|nr:MAG: hypothetical protein CRN43_18410 [Candidatus Nephrothrix sp. EaCA]